MTDGFVYTLCYLSGEEASELFIFNEFSIVVSSFLSTLYPSSSTSNSLPSTPLTFLLAILEPRYVMIGVDPSYDGVGIIIADDLLKTLEFMS